MIKINLRNEIYSKQDRENLHTLESDDFLKPTVEFIRHYFWYDVLLKRFRLSSISEKIYAIQLKKLNGFYNYYCLDISRITQILKLKERE